MAEHPIQAPQELAQQWMLEAHHQDAPPGTCPDTRVLIARAAQWGADQELEACVEFLRKRGVMLSIIEQLRAARRPKVPSLKEQALKALAAIEGDFNTVGDRADTIRRAIEALPDE